MIKNTKPLFNLVKKNQSGYSIAEISIVLIIIALLISSVTYGRKLITRAKIAKLNISSKNAPIWSINDIDGSRSAVLWLDANNSELIQTKLVDDKNKVLQWQTIIGTPAIKKSEDEMPEYRPQGLKPYASVYFDGNDQLTIPVAPILSGDNSYSISIVWLAEKLHSSNLFQQGNQYNDNEIASLHVSAKKTYGFGSNVRMKNYDINQLISTIIVVDNNQTHQNIRLYHNADDKITTSTKNKNSLNLKTNQTFISGNNDIYSSYRFIGHIAEIIIFKSALTDNEAKSVAKYLTDKYQIKN
ncbi:MAG: hypothetical protein ACO2XZ_02455 [Rickettsiales bacterium]